MNRPHPLEIAVGMEHYSTSLRGVGGVLKTRFEDFIVEEIDSQHSIATANIPLDSPCVSDSELSIKGVQRKARNIHFTLQKMGITTLDAATLLAASLKVSRHMVTYAGLKDKRALTAQRMSVPKSALDELQRVNLSRIWIRDFSYARNPITIGDLWGNRFSILLRAVEVSCDEAWQIIAELRSSPILNYFGIQRFGVARPFTHLVGRAVIRGDFEQAVQMILTEPSEYESKSVAGIRKRIQEEGISEKLLDELPKDLRYERLVGKSLLKHPNDFQLAFSKILPRLQTLFVHAYQSYLFNRILSMRFEKGLSITRPEIGDFLIRLDYAHTGRDDWLFVTERNHASMLDSIESGEYGLAGAIPGYASKLPNTLQSEMIRSVLKEEQITLADFRDVHNQNIDSPGGLHLLAITIPDISGSCAEEGLRVEFNLRKGSYATVVLREIMKNSPLNRS